MVAVEAKAMEKGSREIVRTIGPDTLRSIETTKTAVTAMTAEIARHKMKDTDVAESQKRKGGRPAGSPVLTAGKTEKMIASETAVGTETVAHGRIGVRGGPGRTTDPGRTKTGRITDPTVAMMRTSAPKESGDGAQSTGKRPARTAQTSIDRPERTEEGETAAGPQPSNGDRIARLIVKSPGRMPAPRPDETKDRPHRQTAQERGGSQPGEVPRKKAPQLCPEAPRNRGSSARPNGGMEQNQ